MLRGALVIVFLALAFCFLSGLGNSLQAQLNIATWDGGDFPWESAHWNGGQTAAAVFGDNRVSNGAHDITIGGGSQVFYDANALRDFRPRSNVGPTRLTIKDGAVLTHNSFSDEPPGPDPNDPDNDQDGMWTQFDADLTLDNGTFRRTYTDQTEDPTSTTFSGGLMMFGSWRSVPNQQNDIIIKNGGRLENDGQIWFGAQQEHAPGLKVLMTIDNGTVDLTGGLYPQDNDGIGITADLAFFYGYDFDSDECNGCTASLAAKNEEYKINFKGPGSITVDEGGIWIWDQEEPLTPAPTPPIWNGALVTYQQLWDRGILRSDGVSGGLDGVNFDNHFTVTGTAGADDYTLTRKDPVAVVWDGGNGNWEDAKWNGSQTAVATMGNNRGSDGGRAITIGSDSEVFYAANTLRDLRPRIDNGPISITVKDGAVLTHNSFSDEPPGPDPNDPDNDQDGMWTQFDADLTLDNGTFRRTYTDQTEDPTSTTFSGGLMMLGSWRSRPGQQIDVNIINGGRFENDGQLWFGAQQEHAVGLEVAMTIDDGTVDLTGGLYPQDNDGIGITADLAFFYGYDFDDGECNGCSENLAAKNEQYSINFTGPGSITVDEAGIWIWDQEEPVSPAPTAPIWNGAQVTYEQLWERGILQANGQSGLTGATFANFFSVTGAAGANDYILTSLLGAPGLDGDFNGDGKVDAADYVVWRKTDGSQDGYDDWRTNFGRTSGSGSALGSAAVPEPSAMVLLAAAVAAFGCLRRR